VACEGIAELRRRTIPGQLALRARETPQAVAYRAKIRGVYRERSWKDFCDLVARCAFGLRRLGLARSERVAIMGDCCEGWTIADLAAQSLGAISYGIYPTASASEVKYQCEHGGASVFVAEDQEYADKVLALAAELPRLRWIVVLDTTGMFGYDDPRLIRFDALLEKGAAEAAPPGAFDHLIAAVRPEDPAFIIYTSGTTGNPKGAQISHGKHLAATHAFISHYPTLGADPHRNVAFLPLGHVIGRISTITLPLLGHMVPHYGESIEEVPKTLFEVAPTFLFTVPRYLQKFAAGVLVGIEGTTPLKRAVYQAAFSYGRRYAEKRWTGKPGSWETLLYRIARLVAFRPILNKLGLDELELVITGGAATGKELSALWQIWGLNMVEVYGQTESSGAMIAGQKGPFPVPGGVGVPPEHWEVRLADDGEILARSPEVFDGYWSDEAATRATIDAEGWLHTGDVGVWEGGELRIVDRLRDIIVTSGGKTLSPTYIESRLRASPFVAEAVVFGDDRKYLTALIEIELDTVSDWASRNNVAYTGFTSLARNPEVIRLIGREVDTANKSLSRVEQVKAFRIIPKILDPEEEGEPITPTRKVKRRFMYLKFRDLVESMYSHDEEERLYKAVGKVLVH
jgi:long-chain acyl-CoA synthetase